MANKNAPFGLIPIRHKSGAPYNGSVNIYYVPATNANAIYPGDPVARFQGSDARGIPNIKTALAGGGESFTGAVVGIKPFPNDLTLKYIPANTEGYVYVADDTDLVFTIRDNGAGTIGSAIVGRNADLAIGVGNPDTGWSGVTFDGATIGDAATLQLKILRLYDAEGNEPANYGIWEVAINLHTEDTQQAGAPVTFKKIKAAKK